MSKKRKRDEDNEKTVMQIDEAVSSSQNTDSTLKKLNEEEKINVQKKIHHAMKEAARAFKKARDFEIRKIIKRIKITEYVCLLLFII